MTPELQLEWKLSEELAVQGVLPVRFDLNTAQVFFGFGVMYRLLERFELQAKPLAFRVIAGGRPSYFGPNATGGSTAEFPGYVELGMQFGGSYSF